MCRFLSISPDYQPVTVVIGIDIISIDIPVDHHQEVLAIQYIPQCLSTEPRLSKDVLVICVEL